MHPSPDVLGERKYRVGTSPRFVWQAPEPVSSEPSLVVHLTAGDVAAALTVVLAPLTVVGVGDDRRSLAITAVADAAGVQGRYGVGWLLTDADGAFPVRVTRINGTTAYVADALPRDVYLSAGDPGSLQFSTWTAAMPACVTTSLARNVSWDVVYASSYGTHAPALADARDFGLLHIVNQPFNTGLTHATLVHHVATYGEMVPRQQQDWSPQIRLAEEDLVLDIRQEVMGRGATEDDIPVAAQLRPAHINYTLARILDGVDGDQADRMRAMGVEQMRKALRLIWVDDNNDGVPDDGEVQQVTGPRASWAAGGTFPTRRFAPDGAH